MITPAASDTSNRASNRVTFAMSIMVIAMLIIPGMDIIAKLLATRFEMAPASITFARFLVQVILMSMLIIVRTKSFRLSARNSMFNILRGLLIGSASMLFFISVKYMPVADAISIFFVEPIFVMFLSWIFLNERVGWRRVLAAIVGFCGALLVIQPSFSEFGLVSLLPLCTATLFAFYLILTRKYGVDDDPMKMQFFSGIGGVMFCSAAIIFGEAVGIEDLKVTLPNQLQIFGWLFLIGVIATAGHLMIVSAFTIAPASILAPFQYVEIVSATLLGLMIFGDFPNPSKWLGTAIIIGSGLFIFWREQRDSKTFA